MKKFLIILCSVYSFSCNTLSAQSAKVGNVEEIKRKPVAAKSPGSSDSLKIAKLHALAQYPLIKGGIWSGVLPVENPGDIPDPGLEYKLLFKLTAKNPDSLTREVNRSIDEVVRILNLHVAAGIPPARLHPVIVIQGAAIEAVLNDAAFKKSHSFENPNLALISELKKVGAKFIACGQSMAFQEIKRESLLQEVKVALSARTAISGYQAQGYVLYTIEP